MTFSKAGPSGPAFFVPWGVARAVTAESRGPSRKGMFALFLAEKRCAWSPRNERSAGVHRFARSVRDFLKSLIILGLWP